MLRKLLLTSALVGVGGAVLCGTSLYSYLQTGWDRVSARVEDAIPLDFEIERAKRMAHDLVPEIRANMQQIAREEVSLTELQQRITELQTRLTRERSDMGKLKTDMDAGGTAFKYGGRTYTVSQVKADLTQRLERCKTHDATLDQLQKIYSAREQGLAAARQKLDQMLVGKRRLEAEIENLEARLKMLQVANNAENHQLDESQYGRVRELVGELNTRLQVAEKLVSTQAAPIGEIPVSEEPTGEVADQVAEYLGKFQADTSTVADSDSSPRP